jgi:phosphoglycerate kinase
MISAAIRVLDGVPLLADAPVVHGSRWIYSAGFNVAAGFHGRERRSIAVDWRRVDTEVPDLRRLLEQSNDPALGIEFAKLGDLVAIGGFAKAHRRHASNVGVLAYRPGFAADSLVKEVDRLAPWMDPDDGEHSVAVLGGVKPEKTDVGLVNLIDRYDLVIVGGVVLNVILAAQGHPVGGSELGGSATLRCIASARAVLSRPHRARLHIPNTVMVATRTARGLRRRRLVRVGTTLGSSEAIVDFMLAPWARRQLEGLPTRAGRCLMAGTPALYTHGCRTTTDALLRAFAARGVQSLLLGGDTLAELPWEGPASSGGGSALTLLAAGTCEVFDALRTSRPKLSLGDSDLHLLSRAGEI